MNLFMDLRLISPVKVIKNLILGIANPVGTILSGAMLLEMSLGMVLEARALEKAVEFVLDEQLLRTRDLGGQTTTADMGSAIASAFKKNLEALYQ
jgi:3-isopropylmalate dehydrogenase